MLLAMIEKLSENDVVPVKGMDIKEGKTSPPKRYSSVPWCLPWENEGQLIEDEELRAQIKGSGIGTSVGAEIIGGFSVRVGYLNLNRKSRLLTPTILGEMIVETVSMTVPELLEPQDDGILRKGTGRHHQGHRGYGWGVTGQSSRILSVGKPFPWRRPIGSRN